MDRPRCNRCKRRPPATGRKQCLPCTDNIGRLARELSERRAAAGLCIRHGNPRIAGTARCEVCRVEERARRDREAERAGRRRPVPRPRS